MASSPEKGAGKLSGSALYNRQAEAEVFTSALPVLELACAWLLLVSPLAAAYFRLGGWLDSAVEGARLSVLALLAFAAVAGFAALALGLEFSAQGSRLGTSEPEGGNIGGQVSRLAFPAAALPLVFSAFGAALAWIPLGDSLTALLLFIVAAATAFSNAFCWFFAHHLAKQIAENVSPKEEASFPSPVFHIRRFKSHFTKYTPPVYPALTSLVFSSLFIFAFTFRSPASAPPALFGWQGSALAVVVFIFGLLGLLALGRFSSLFSTTRREHLASAAAFAADDHSALSWATQVGLLILFTGLIAAALPLEALVRIGEFFRLHPPQSGLLPQPQPVGRETISLLRLLLSGGVFGWLLWLLAVAMASLALWLLRHWAKKVRLLERLVQAARFAWRSLRLWLERLFPRGARSSMSGSREILEQEPESDRLLDVFEQPEMLARLSPAQIIMATFHLLLEYAKMRGWLRRISRPPFEILHTLSEKTRLDHTDLTCLTWAYAEAAYSQIPVPGEKLAQVQAAWSRIKPRLLEEVEE